MIWRTETNITRTSNCQIKAATTRSMQLATRIINCWPSRPSQAARPIKRECKLLINLLSKLAIIIKIRDRQRK